MSCESWQDKLDGFVDAELTAAETAAFEAHLGHCQDCATEALGRIRVKSAMRAAGHRYTASPEFRLKIAREFAAPKQSRPSRWSWDWGWQWRLGMVAAVLALAIGLSLLWSSRGGRERAMGELADLHVAALASANPVDVVSSDRHTVKPWFAGKLPFTFNVPELANTPFQLTGGRLAYFEQSPGAQLLLQVRKHQISVFIFSERALGKLPASAVEHKVEFTIQTWTQNGLRYFVVSDASPADVAALSELFKAAA